MTEKDDQISALRSQIERLKSHVDRRFDALGGASGRYVADLKQLREDLAAEVKAELAEVRGQLAVLVGQTERAWVQQDLQARLAGVRAQLAEFAAHDAVRKAARQILRVLVDQSVPLDTLRDTAERLRADADGYWLAPALAGVVGWARDDEPAATAAFDEAYGLDAARTALFATAVSVRLRRDAMTTAWFTRYLDLHDPQALPGEFVTAFDAAVSGGLGPVGAALIEARSREWLAMVAADPGQRHEHTVQWSRTLDSFRAQGPDLPSGLIDMWEPEDQRNIQEALGDAKVFATAERAFQAWSSGPPTPSTVDAVLLRLIDARDPREAEIRAEEARLSTQYRQVLETEGDEPVRADPGGGRDKPATVTFPALLRQAACRPSSIGTGPVTRRAAIALSADLIVAGARRLADEHPLARPESFRLKVFEWRGNIADPAGEEAVRSSFLATAEAAIQRRDREIRAGHRRTLILGAGATAAALLLYLLLMGTRFGLGALVIFLVTVVASVIVVVLGQRKLPEELATVRDGGEQDKQVGLQRLRLAAATRNRILSLWRDAEEDRVLLVTSLTELGTRYPWPDPAARTTLVVDGMPAWHPLPPGATSR